MRKTWNILNSTYTFKIIIYEFRCIRLWDVRLSLTPFSNGSRLNIILIMTPNNTHITFAVTFKHNSDSTFGIGGYIRKA